MSTAVITTAVGLVRTLRAAGLAVGVEQAQSFIAALAELDPTRRVDVYWAGRLTLCAHADDVTVYDRAFVAYFSADDPLRRPPPRAVLSSAPPGRLSTVALPGTGEGQRREELMASKASGIEALRRADLAGLTDAERAQAHQLIATLRVPADLRRTRRFGPARRGQVDRAATVRALLRNHGELDRVRRRRRREQPRRLVVLVDVSGSMEPYAEALVRFAHATRQRGAPTEVFSLGTRLTRLTAELTHRDPDRAMAAVAARIADWSGGTRLGALVREFLDRWGQRGMARGAVVVVLSDGWERDDPSVLGGQMQRLSRLAHRVVWANPLRARPGFAPLAGGMAAALPHIDDFVDGHSVAALQRLAQVIAGVDDRVAPYGVNVDA